MRCFRGWWREAEGQDSLAQHWLYISAVYEFRLALLENMHENCVLAFFNHALHAKTERNRQPNDGRVCNEVEGYGHLDRMVDLAARLEVIPFG